MTTIPASSATRSSVESAILPFSKIDRSDVPIVGGKGANLGEMTAAGLPVPPGFVIAIDAYRRFYDSNELGPRVTAGLGRLRPDEPDALGATARRLQQMILDGEMPEELQVAIAGAYDALVSAKPSNRVAVRSSAAAEDTAQFSFAGMFESFLNVAGETGLLEAVKAC